MPAFGSPKQLVPAPKQKSEMNVELASASFGLILPSKVHERVMS